MTSKNVIVINGRRYDAHTGHALDGRPTPRPRVEHHAPAHHAAKHHPAEATHQADQVRPRRGAAHHATAHAPEHARTLMRQAVKKPDDGLKRRIKVQGRVSGEGRASSRILNRSGARQPDTARLQNLATKRTRGQLISHFSPELFSVDSHTPAATYGAAPVRRTAVRPPLKAAKPKKSWTTDELLEYAVQRAAEPRTPAAARPRRKLFLKRAHAGGR